ncbi:hypothetical protein B0H63DRAFT_515511 [Podospora didyma]|uniref:Uncharacterized protein n=1 Tax=Podospora didyma TaxID=330526 RepID=A0AAE0K161_9PEZI|nr:hypothetical protein B0H63DRAFT_515511 [Podospora didyma]
MSRLDQEYQLGVGGMKFTKLGPRQNLWIPPAAAINSSLDGVKYIQQCVRNNCAEFGETIYEVPYFTSLGNSCIAVIATVTATLQATNIPAAPTATVGLITKPVLIEKPDSSYNALSPCVRWVLNNCQSSKDNADSCHADRPGDHSKIWCGLGAYLQCETAECVCGGSKFFYSTQKLYERADLYCSIGFPCEGAASNPGFELTITMLADYCSAEGFVLGEWIVTLVGFQHETGMSQETKTSIGVGAASGVLTIISIVLAWLTLRKM